MEKSFFTPLLLSLRELNSACCREALAGWSVRRLPEGRGSPGPHHAHSTHCTIDAFGLICFVLPCCSSCCAIRFSARCLPLPPVAGASSPFARAVGRDRSLARLRATPLQPFPRLLVLFSSKYPLLKKSLGKRSKEAAAWHFSWTHTLPGSLRGEAKVNPLEAKRESCTMCFFFFSWSMLRNGNFPF